jgi:hypothetical protein
MNEMTQAIGKIVDVAVDQRSHALIQTRSAIGLLTLIVGIFWIEGSAQKKARGPDGSPLRCQRSRRWPILMGDKRLNVKSKEAGCDKSHVGFPPPLLARERVPVGFQTIQVLINRMAYHLKNASVVQWIVDTSSQGCERTSLSLLVQLFESTDEPYRQVVLV